MSRKTVLFIVVIGVSFSWNKPDHHGLLLMLAMQMVLTCMDAGHGHGISCQLHPGISNPHSKGMSFKVDLKERLKRETWKD